MSQRKLVYMALLVAQGVILSLVESMLPFSIGIIPGARLGLANSITLIALYTLPVRDAILMAYMRLLISSLFGGGASMFIYSFAGVTLSLFVSILAIKLFPKSVSVVGVSVLGGFMHNLGQLLIAVVMTKTWSTMLYLPILGIAGVFSGLGIGIVVSYLLKHVAVFDRIKTEFKES